MTNSAFRSLTTAETIFKSLIWEPAVKAGTLALEADFPFLALPVIENIGEAAIQAVSDWAFNSIVLFVDVTAIRLVNSEHQSAYDSASLQMKVIAVEKGIDSDEFKNARDAATAALSKFTRFGS